MTCSLELGSFTFPLLFIANLLALWVVVSRTGVPDHAVVLARQSSRLSR